MKKIITILSLITGVNVNAQVCFNAATPNTVGTKPSSVIIYDFNGDGFDDVVTSNHDSNDISVLLGTGTGTFGSAASFSVGTAPVFGLSADFNNDGKKDVMTANYTSSDISVLIGTGTGSFGSSTSFAAGAQPYSATSADFNGDGFIDLAVVNYGSNNVSILLGTGTGSFAAPANFNVVGTGAISICSADFNGDSKIDLAVATWVTNDISVLLGDGTGSFSAATSFTSGAGNEPQTVISADFNGDSKIDLATANYNSNNVSILLGTGTGSFSPASAFAAGTNPYSLCSADLNGDGNADLNIANNGSNNVSVLMGSGTGSFSSAINFSVGTNPGFVQQGDFNEDGKIDLATANGNSDNVSILLNCNAFLCSSPNISSNLIASYSFSGNANDQSANNYNGTVNGATLTTDRFGNANAAYNFNGTSDFIEVSDNTALRLNNSDFTISTWINENSRTSTQESIISKRTGAGGNGYILNIEGSVQPTPGLSNFHVSGGADPRAFSNTVVPLSVWKHIAVIYELSSQTIRTYIDGVLDNTTTGIPTPNAATNVAMRIGTDAAGNPYFFHGKIDDIKIYARALSVCDIDSLFNSPNPVSTGISQLTHSSGFKIYPNPANNFITIEFTALQNLMDCNMQIINALGQQVYQSTITQQQNHFDLSTITSPGIYFVQITDRQNHTVETRKIVLH